MSVENKICIFTIVSNNYLHYANTLFDSVKYFCPEANCVLGLCDLRTQTTYCPNAEIIELKDLNIEHLGQFIYQYTILELNTAIKPYVIEALFDRGYEKVIYFDPDIRLFSSLKKMLSLLDSYNVLLTPHLTGRLEDSCSPSELDILRAGVYNLGYLGLRMCDETQRLVSWWKEKLYRNCVVDLEKGLFVDQKWMDLAPSLFSGVNIVRDETWNVAYWNMTHRSISNRGEYFFVNGQPLVFFHFSGFSTVGKTLSKHQNRHTKDSEGPALRKLCDIYSRCLEQQNISLYSGLAYAFADFADGTAVPDSARRVLRENPRNFAQIDFFDPGQTGAIFEFFNSRAAVARNAPVLVTQLMAALWSSRRDLQFTFPDFGNTDAVRYVEWVLANSEREAGFSSVFLADSKVSLIEFRGKSSSSGAKKTKSSIKNKLVRAIWDRREAIPLSWRLALGEPIANWAFSYSYPKSQVATPQAPKKIGINLVGYMEAESGVGEAARSSYRALSISDIPHCVIDYRVGNISRMNHTMPCHYSRDAKYAINLIHVNADQSKVARHHLQEQLAGTSYNIGFWYWEMPTFPDELTFAFDYVDEIWVATNYVKDAISSRTEKPVHVVPPNIDMDAVPEIPLDDIHLCDNHFIFYHMSDVLSMEERKNPLGVVKAFLKAFANDPANRVQLVLKISNLNQQTTLRGRINSLIESEPRITLIDGYMDSAVLKHVMTKINCYVSLHRAEGFGLPIAEAMAAGKPVIATNWSGNVDFMNYQNSLPVDFKIITLKEDIGPYKKGNHWAEPSLTDAAQKMRLISSDNKLADQIGGKALDYIEDNFSPKVSASVMSKRIAAITESLN